MQPKRQVWVVFVGEECVEAGVPWKSLTPLLLGVCVLRSLVLTDLLSPGQLLEQSRPCAPGWGGFQLSAGQHGFLEQVAQGCCPPWVLLCPHFLPATQGH